MSGLQAENDGAGGPDDDGTASLDPSEAVAPSPALDGAVAAVRRFSRFYTARIGVLHEGLSGSDLSLAEGRIVWELAQDRTVTATDLSGWLDLDPGYLSRLLRGLQARDLIGKQASARDGREMLLSLTAAGRAVYDCMDRRSHEDVARVVEGLGPADLARLAGALETATALLGGVPVPPAEIDLRGPRPGDIGWIVHRHGVLYAEEYGWDWRFEALVAKVAATFVETADPLRECCRIADRGGAVLGSAFVTRQDDDTAKLRLVYVEPAARGTGLGRRLVTESLDFARNAGYARMTLWTNDVLVAARRLYVSLGFELIRSKPHHSFGHDLVGETWEREL